MNRRVYLLAGAAALAVMALIYAHMGSAPVAATAVAPKSVNKSSDQPTTAPSDDSVLPPQYVFLEASSPFGKGAGPGGMHHNGPEAAFIFCGTVQTGTTITAFIENAANKAVVEMAIGQSVARGHIKKIDLDAMEYESAGNTRRIEVGQNFYGDMPQPTAPPAGPPPPQGMNGPPGPDQNGNPPAMPQMRPRRQRPG